ncbi:MAG: metal-dependent hydrolase [Desulfobacterales bacterium]|nr:metal-dependent hydrolase [Desulfobacterales bacterium]
MAEFKTHLTVSSFLSSASSVMIYAAGLATPQEVLLYFVMGVIGGLLPDIDSDSSLTVRLLFTFIATVISFLIMFHQKTDNSALELYGIWLMSFFVMNYIFFSLFTRITIHRGLIHSVPASVLFWFLSTLVLYHCFNFSLPTVWMAGFFLFGGFLSHLFLDELASLDLGKKRPKRSSGTAFKFGSARDLKSTIAVYVVTTLLFFATPDHKPFVETFFASKQYAAFKALPENGWFNDLTQRYIVRWQTRGKDECRL